MHPLLVLADKEKLHHDDFARVLNAAKANAATTKDKPRKIADGGGLHLLVMPRGLEGQYRRLWRYAYRIDGRHGLYAIGSLSDFGLADARKIHRAARWLVERRIHPLHYVKQELERQHLEAAHRNSNTFAALAETWLTRDESKRAANTIAQRRRELKNDVLPAIGKRPIGDIRKPELTDLLKKIQTRAPEVARNVRQHMAGIFAYAEDAGLINGSPVPGPKVLNPRHQTPHAALSPKNTGELGEFLRSISTGRMNAQTRIALRLLLLTVVRKHELLAAYWDEFDLDRAQWNIPADRMKMRAPHWVPLSYQAVELLHELHKLSYGDLLFPNVRDPKKHMSGNSINAVLSRLGYLDKTKPHGLRSLFSTYANSVHWNPDVIERCLAHKPKDAIRAKYNRHEYEEEQREIMQNWADQLDRWYDGKGADVVPIHKGKRI